MRAADGIASFVASPIGRFVRGRTYLAWCCGPRFFGSAHWSRSRMAEILELIEIVKATRRLRPPFDVITDARFVESTPGVVGVDVAARFAAEQLAPYRASIRRHAILHGVGLSGPVLAGFLPALGLGHAWSLFSDPTAAYAWLSNPQAETARARVEALLVAEVQVPPAVAALREYLGHEGAEPTVAAAARAIGMSQRSLQRRLREAATTFRNELAQARVRAAMPLVLESDVKLETIARQLGLSSLTAFSRFYRRQTGELPSRARPRRRGARG